MKLLKFIGMLLIAMIMCVNFIACGDDENSEKLDLSLLEGTWYVTHEVYYDYVDGKIDWSKVVYEASPTLVVSEPRVFSKDVDGIYYYNGEKIIINNSQFVTSSNDRVTIESLTPHKMVIAWEDDIFCDDEGEWAFVYYTLERK